ncbi:hypothetical protein [Bradyrhizobium sp. SZCCHNRI3043]|uniref:hypothetical protein n=1 Tax=Bradyrhizobium sp. SZCCHNRI3043 TaxID=3057292 RepID=UPI0028E5A895|nr:hypothetical protein [Bradyrhizobium sp. SZCCHNRI3043]
MTRWKTFVWTAVAAAICSLFVTIEIGKDREMAVFEAISGLLFLLGASWAVAGLVYVVSLLKARRQTLMVVAISVIVALSAATVIWPPR